MHDHAALAALVGLVVEHRGAGRAQQVERAEQVDRDHPVERLDAVRAALAGGLLGPADARARDRDPQRPVAARGDHRLVDLRRSVTSQATKPRARRARRRARCRARASTSAIVTSAPGGVQAPRGRGAEPRGAAADERPRSLDQHGRTLPRGVAPRRGDRPPRAVGVGLRRAPARDRDAHRRAAVPDACRRASRCPPPARARSRRSSPRRRRRSARAPG